MQDDPKYFGRGDRGRHAGGRLQPGAVAARANRVVKSAVTNQHVAPTIIAALGLDPDELQAVRQEQIAPLPFLFKGHFESSVSPF